MLSNEKSYTEILKDPLIWGNFLLRLFIITLVIYTKHWNGGDSYDYIENAKGVCDGNWGGYTFRPPFYAWYLCALSIKGFYAFSIPLLLQTLMVWGCGVFVIKKCGRLIGFFWLFEPALLVYSNLLMPDVIFAMAVLFLGFSIYSLTQKTKNNSYLSYACFGFILGLCALIKSIAIPLAFLNLFFITIWLFKSRFQNIKYFLFACTIFFLVVSPKLYWNVTKFHEWTLASQGSGWMGAVAGVVENDGKGLDFLQSEIKFFKDHPEEYHRNDKVFFVKTILTNFPTWVKLSSKGFLRVLFGHVNAEWAMLWSGVAPVGPGWFKVKDNRDVPMVTGAWIWMWALGVLMTAGFCLYVYFRTYRAIITSKSYRETFMLWMLAMILFLAIMPQVYGDARFRIPLWPLVLLLWGLSERRILSVSL